MAEKFARLRGNTENSAAKAGESVGSAKIRASSLKATPGMFVTCANGSFRDNYKAVKLLGKGSFGEVLLCLNRETGQQYAVKVILKSSVKRKGDHESLLREVNVLKSLDHPNIMKIFEFYEDEKYYYFVTELYTGGELFDEIVSRKCFSEQDAAKIIKQVLSGINYMHKQNVVHRDLKPENLLLESKEPNANIRIIDFGLSTYCDLNSKMKDKIGTAYYIAPDVLKGVYDSKCDIWSIGVILYILLCGFPPFNGANESEIIKKVQTGKYTFDLPQWRKVSESAKDLISRMITYNPAKRISANEALEHHWLTYMTRDYGVDLPSLELSINNMKSFYYTQKLSQAALLYIGSKLITKEESNHLTTIFRRMDTNGDGQLDRNELIRGFSEYLHLKGSPLDDSEVVKVEEQVDQILQDIDFDKNGFIDYSEFLTVAMDRRNFMQKERLEKAFKLFDADNSGSISSAELGKLFGVTDVSEEDWQRVLHEVDTNNDGVIDFAEFQAMLSKLV
ncbi:calcium-dependent protein kinase 4, putative [Babesia bigemina]|uniref:non-specific serine/threonine protein kinase n=1 Tax=Babesia bigemina TaxID=5866 RepID=A0A061D2I8_BABBI|nr:calcium-dependent protein kinase 4, putative [Babesia bigemina]CDR94798.1 calcium-dependent protein kinase 4, putative [Babesia bigemina]|eukprot:XP_012766984.1 calcium-dependent protein kinase 4, putative [Babesia bigemina]